ncbi:MAG TPA: sulfurtransferase TusA family protein [Dehalococcoidia bacterium]|nr:sulfurtransferase TusA family protein [Dehalococcoidia bacterium]
MKQEIPDTHHLLDAPGEACANLPPLIKAGLRDLASGEVLMILSDDLSAREGVPAWCRLSGNALVATVEEDAHKTRFYIRKK